MLRQLQPANSTCAERIAQSTANPFSTMSKAASGPSFFLVFSFFADVARETDHSIGSTQARSYAVQRWRQVAASNNAAGQQQLRWQRIKKTTPISLCVCTHVHTRLEDPERKHAASLRCVRVPYILLGGERGDSTRRSSLRLVMRPRRRSCA